MKMMRSLFSPILVACVAVILWGGCGGGGAAPKPTGTVSGKVTMKGAPLPKVTVTFFGDGDTAAAVTKDDGTYSLVHGASADVPAGEYKVSVTSVTPVTTMDPTEMMKQTPAATPVKSPIPEKYAKAEKSGLTAVIKAGANADVNFDLK